MKTIFAYTVEHTGGTFACNLFSNSFPESKFTWLGDAHAIQRGRDKGLDAYPCNALTSEWFDRHVTRYTKSQEKKDVCLVHAHHEHPLSALSKALKGVKPEIPTFSSLRDPLLSIHTFLWRRFAVKGIRFEDEDRDVRWRIADKFARLVEDILSIPANHLFIYPVDLLSSFKPVRRIEYTQDLMKFCGLPFTEQCKSFVSNWKSLGDTSKSWHLQQRAGSEEFLRSKSILLSGDSKLVRHHMDVEVDCLSQYKDLAFRLQQVGYRDLSWW
jgi:hypothetical protein